tara:strand:- start:1712 stop:2050 length:339 start_codon:yes stop_codon:yes gene_type:complete
MADKFDIQGIIKKVRVSMNPELGVPADEKENPVNYRIIHLRKLLKEAIEKQRSLTAELTKIESNLLGLLEELNPDLDLKDESDLNEDTDKSEAKTDDEVTKEEAPKDEDKKE